MQYLQAMPLEVKVKLTQQRIREFYNQFGGAYVSFSGGKDSAVLLDIARKIHPDIPACFSDTGLEYQEIRKFALSHCNVDVVRPKIRFDEVISKYGYPLIGKEVAEAIYYARRLRPVEREREPEDGHLIQTSGSRNRRKVLLGAYPLSTHTHTSERTSQHHRTELNGTRQRSGRNFKGNGSEADEPG